MFRCQELLVGCIIHVRVLFGSFVLLLFWSAAFGIKLTVPEPKLVENFAIRSV